MFVINCVYLTFKQIYSTISVTIHYILSILHLFSINFLLFYLYILAKIGQVWKTILRCIFLSKTHHNFIQSNIYTLKNFLFGVLGFWGFQGRHGSEKTLWESEIQLQVAVENFPEVLRPCSGYLKHSSTSYLYARKKIRVRRRTNPEKT